MNEHACKMHTNHYPDTFFARPKRLELQYLYDAKERKVINMKKGEKSHDAFTEFCIINYYIQFALPKKRAIFQFCLLMPIYMYNLFTKNSC